MKVSNLDTIEFIFNFIYSVFIYLFYLFCIYLFILFILYLFIHFIYSVAWLFLGYGIIQAVQKMLLLKRR